MQLEHILQELEGIQLFLEQEPNDENMIASYGDTLAVYLSRTSMLMAESKFNLEESTFNAIIEHKDKDLSPMIFKKFIDSITRHESRAFMIAERMNRACTHRLDWCRTRLSFYKYQINS